jgi:probable phosphoglycerate mutase
MQLLLIRHAEPIRVAVTPDGRPADPPLHDRGRTQARQLAEWLRVERLDGLYSSPLRRARQTAAAIGEVHRLEVEVDPELAEYDQDATSYIPFEELRATKDPRYYEMIAGRTEAYGVAAAEFRDRAIEAVERLVERHPGQSIALVCHGGVINAYTGSVIGASRLLFFEPAYCSISRVAANRSNVRTIVSLNEACHLRHIGT